MNSCSLRPRPRWQAGEILRRSHRASNPAIQTPSQILQSSKARDGHQHGRGLFRRGVERKRASKKRGSLSAASRLCGAPRRKRKGVIGKDWGNRVREVLPILRRSYSNLRRSRERRPTRRPVDSDLPQEFFADEADAIQRIARFERICRRARSAVSAHESAPSKLTGKDLCRRPTPRTSKACSSLARMFAACARENSAARRNRRAPNPGLARPARRKMFPG